MQACWKRGYGQDQNTLDKMRTTMAGALTLHLWLPTQAPSSSIVMNEDLFALLVASPPLSSRGLARPSPPCCSSVLVRFRASVADHTPQDQRQGPIKTSRPRPKSGHTRPQGPISISILVSVEAQPENNVGSLSFDPSSLLPSFPLPLLASPPSVAVCCLALRRLSSSIEVRLGRSPPRRLCRLASIRCRLPSRPPSSSFVVHRSPTSSKPTSAPSRIPTLFMPTYMPPQSPTSSGPTSSLASIRCRLPSRPPSSFVFHRSPTRSPPRRRHASRRCPCPPLCRLRARLARGRPRPSPRSVAVCRPALHCSIVVILHRSPTSSKPTSIPTSVPT
jgi:hypothetical protein